MTCPKCGGKIDTKDTRHTPENETLRLKECRNCGRRFKSIEFETMADAALERLWRLCDRSNKSKGARK